jgi:hypothetical protein
MRLGIALVIAFGIAHVASASGGQYATCPLASIAADTCGPRLEFEFGAAIDPKELPTHQMEPVALEFSGLVRNGDRSHPPALREATVDFDDDIAIDAARLPSCRGGQLKTRNTKAARRLCRNSIVGKGIAHVAITPLAEPIPITLTLFSGGVKEGVRRLFIHSFIKAPAPAAIVTVVKIQKKDGGLHTTSKIPSIAGGSASLLDFEFTVKRIFSYKGEKMSYLEARCPDGVFKVNAPKLLFRNGAQTPGLAAATVLKGAIAVPCSSEP